MKAILVILFLFLGHVTMAQLLFKPGAYKPGDEVTWTDGKVYVNQKACASCKATPPNNSYWKVKEAPAITVEFLLKKIEDLELKVKNMVQIRELYNSGPRLIIYDTIQRRAAW